MAGKEQQYPAIKGLTWHRHQYYSFFAPLGWHAFSWPDDRLGEIYGPDADDPNTVFALSVDDLGSKVTESDLNDLAEGFFEGVEALPGVAIEQRSQQATNGLLELEARYTYQDEGATRRCWVRVLYHDTRQITMTAKGATPEKYEYWLPMFFESMMTARVHNSLPDAKQLG